jgi:phage-related protein
MTTVFTWNPSVDATCNEQMRNSSAQFGDGYKLDSPDGINNRKKVWTLTFNNRPFAEAQAIRTFLVDHGGYLAFDWTDPDGDTLRYTCGTIPRTFKQGLYQTFNLTFEQAFGK